MTNAVHGKFVVNTRTMFVSAALRTAVAVAAVVLVLAAPTATAHIRMTDPTPRSSSDSLKSSPCGGVSYVGKQRTTLQGGSTATITFDETIGHTGLFRIAFAEQSTESGADFDSNMISVRRCAAAVGGVRRAEQRRRAVLVLPP